MLSTEIIIGLDNTCSSMGIRNSIKSRILQKKTQKCLFLYLGHLAAGAGGKAYQGIMEFDMEDHQVDMPYFFKNSTQCKGILLEYFEFMG